MTREDKVNEFRTAAGQKTFNEDPEGAELVFECIYEEFAEFIEASIDYEENETSVTRANLCKEWADLQYVVSQAAAYYGIDGEEAFNRVHSSNMSKVVNGEVVRRDDGKILKPETYVPPFMGGL